MLVQAKRLPCSTYDIESDVLTPCLSSSKAHHTFKDLVVRFGQ